MPKPEDEKTEKTREPETKTESEQPEESAGEGAGGDGAPESVDPLAALGEILSGFREEVAAFRQEMGSIKETFGALSNQQALSDSISAEQGSADDSADKQDSDEYPSVDLEEFARTIGDY